SRACESCSDFAKKIVQVTSEANAKLTMMMSALRNIDHGDRSCGARLTGALSCSGRAARCSGGGGNASGGTGRAGSASGAFAAGAVAAGEGADVCASGGVASNARNAKAVTPAAHRRQDFILQPSSG